MNFDLAAQWVAVGTGQDTVVVGHMAEHRTAVERRSEGSQDHIGVPPEHRLQ